MAGACGSDIIGCQMMVPFWAPYVSVFSRGPKKQSSS